MAERIEAIRLMLDKEHDNAFLLYSPAVEYASDEQYGEAVETFDNCISADGDYLPAHVERAEALRSAGRLDKARDAFAAAMEPAATGGKPHVRDCVLQQLDGLGG